MMDQVPVTPEPAEKTTADQPLATETAEEAEADGKLHIGRLLLGKPKDPHDQRLFHRLSLVPLLAWIGLGADGLSSSSYGPEEAFRVITGHPYLAIPLAILTAVTVCIVSACYMRIIEVFPHGGGGYLVATKLLGERWGILAGSALLVDYVMTITVSIAGAGDALFSLFPREYQTLKLGAEVAAIIILTLLNLRGVRESILVLVPIFVTFIVTHVLLIAAGVAFSFNAAASSTPESVDRAAVQGPGLWVLTLLLLKAYSMGGGTYTGIEAVSNGLSVLRPPQVQNGKRTMLYMAGSLSFTAAGLLLCYLFLGLRPTEDLSQTMNALLSKSMLEKLLPGLTTLQGVLLFVTLASEGALLIVGAQAGFIGGPRVMANMAVDSLLPHRFASLSDRFTTSNGILLMAATSLAALVSTSGNIRALLVMYSINVFVTFSLAQLGMIRHWWTSRGKEPCWRRRLCLFTVGFVFCFLILVITVLEKFTEGGWLTIIVTASLVLVCVSVKAYYRRIGRRIAMIGEALEGVREENVTVPDLDPNLPTAGVLVNVYSGMGIHSVLRVLRAFPGYFKNFHFISVGTIDSGNFKGQEAIRDLEVSTQENLKKYEELARGLGFPARSSFRIGTDTVEELEKVCLAASKCYRNIVFFSGKIIFEREKWYHFLFHNLTAYSLQKRLQWAGLMMLILPIRILESPRRPVPAQGAPGPRAPGTPAGPATPADPAGTAAPGAPAASAAPASLRHDQ